MNRESPKHFPKPNLHQKRSWSLVVCCWSDPRQLSESWWTHCIWELCSANWWCAPETAVLSSGIDQQKGPSFSPWQCLTTWHTTNSSKVEWIGLQSFTSSAMFTCLSPADYHFFKHLDNFLQGKCSHNQQDAENGFQEFAKSWSMGILCFRNKQTYFSLAKMCWL